MKRMFTVLLAGIMLFSLTGCAGAAPKDERMSASSVVYDSREEEKTAKFCEKTCEIVQKIEGR